MTNCASSMKGLQAKGMNAGKVKVGLNLEDDHAPHRHYARRAGQTSGKTPLLMIDSNEYWSPKQAIRHVRELEKTYDLFWVEEPARRWDYRGLRKVSQGVNAAVSTGENLHDIGDFMALIANEGCRCLSDRCRHVRHHRRDDGGRHGARLRASRSR